MIKTSLFLIVMLLAKLSYVIWLEQYDIPTITTHALLAVFSIAYMLYTDKYALGVSSCVLNTLLI